MRGSGVSPLDRDDGLAPIGTAARILNAAPPGDEEAAADGQATFPGHIVSASGSLSLLQHVGLCIYYSFVTFVTIGAENVHPRYGGWMPLVVGLQGFSGLFLMTLFVATFTRKILR